MVRFLTIFVFSVFHIYCLGQNFSLQGTITDKQNKKPVEFASVVVIEQDLWSVSNISGEFLIKNIGKGTAYVTASCMGYITQTIKIDINSDVYNFNIVLQKNNLSLKEVVVTAKKEDSNLSSSYNISQNSLNHSQILNVAEVTSLLPGGKSNSFSSLTNPMYLSLRSESNAEEGLASFGTAVEVDGIRLSNNNNYSGDITNRNGNQNYFRGNTKGADLRSISTANIESVEIITGIPSAEEGDLESGIVKINTQKGKLPLTVKMLTNINTKQVAVNKGFQLGKKSKILNTSYEYTKSVREVMSPFSTYKRNNLTLRYSESFNNTSGSPILLSAVLTGNIGGYNEVSDPDLLTNTYTKEQDNTVRANINLKYLANKRWLTNLKFLMSAVYSDKLYTSQDKNSTASYVAAIHSKENGYFIGELYKDNPNANIILINEHNWYETYFDDSKALDLRAKVKADLVKNFNIFRSKSKLGADYTVTGNLGKGMYYSDIKYAPTWRSFPYNKIPFMHNIALFAEEKGTFSFTNHQKIEFLVGVRSDNTIIENSAYSTVSSFSPRLNAKYSLKTPSKNIKKISIHTGWGQTVKLPSFYILHPKTSYSDILAFAPGTMSNGAVFYAYHTKQCLPVYNPDLEWQKGSLTEIGFDTQIKNINFSLTAYYRKTSNPYTRNSLYDPFSYKLTTQEALNNCIIPEGNRSYEINKETGIVTVKDITGTLAPEQLDYKLINNFNSNYIYENGSPIHRYGLEWVVDFGKIKLLNTKFRIDGNYYTYKSCDEVLKGSRASASGADGKSYKYIAYYIGGSSIYNSKISKQVSSNFTAITHIPKIRLIISLRLEADFYNFNQNMSLYNGKQRGFVINDKGDLFPSDENADIHSGKHYVAIYPEYYVSSDDMDTKIPFEEKFKWAKDNDPELYSDLAKMVKKSNYLNFYAKDITSPYLSANINLTKEIGEHISVSFNAKNFFNNMGIIKSTKYNKSVSLYKSGRIPSFYYGLTVRLKL